MSKVYAKIKDGNGNWIEGFDEGSTEESIKQMIVRYNEDASSKETEREFVKLISEEEYKRITPEKIDSLEGATIGRTEIDGYVPIKNKEDGYVVCWVKKDWIKQIKKNKLIDKIPSGELERNRFKCFRISSMFIPTEYVYIESVCQKCAMLKRTRGQMYDCLLRKHRDKM